MERGRSHHSTRFPTQVSIALSGVVHCATNLGAPSLQSKGGMRNALYQANAPAVGPPGAPSLQSKGGMKNALYQANAPAVGPPVRPAPLLNRKNLRLINLRRRGQQLLGLREQRLRNLCPKDAPLSPPHRRRYQRCRTVPTPSFSAYHRTVPCSCIASGNADFKNASTSASFPGFACRMASSANFSINFLLNVA